MTKLEKQLELINRLKVKKQVCQDISKEDRETFESIKKDLIKLNKIENEIKKIWIKAIKKK